MIERDRKSLEEAIKNINRRAHKKGLELNQNKTEYKKVGRNEREHDKIFEIGNYSFEETENCRYLGTAMNNQNARNVEITQRIQVGFVLTTDRKNC